MNPRELERRAMIAHIGLMAKVCAEVLNGEPLGRAATILEEALPLAIAGKTKEAEAALERLMGEKAT